jgi:hypothetical protein
VAAYVHSWTTSQCSANWTVWQYTSCGIAPKYGVPGSRLDLNVFAGAPEKFQSLLTGTWIPDIADEMPHGETTTMMITSVSASTTNKNAVISVEVKRPDSTPVVTGAVKYYFTSANQSIPKVTQTVARETSGSWKLSIEGLPAGTWIVVTLVLKMHLEPMLKVSCHLYSLLNKGRPHLLSHQRNQPSSQ